MLSLLQVAVKLSIDYNFLDDNIETFNDDEVINGADLIVISVKKSKITSQVPEKLRALKCIDPITQHRALIKQSHPCCQSFFTVPGV